MELLRRIVSALDALPVRGIVTTGPTIDPTEVPGSRSVQVISPPTIPDFSRVQPSW